MSAPRSDNFKTIPIDRIVIGDRQRTFDPAGASAIAATLPDMGLKKPIEVSADGSGWRLIAGFHRLQACIEAGWTEVPARIVTLDDANIEASASLHEALENLIHNQLSALDRMAHLAAAKQAHDELYPQASKAGRPKKVTRNAEENLQTFGRFSFSREVAQHIGFTQSLVNILTKAYGRLSVQSRTRLRSSRFADRQGELLALAELEPIAQKVVLDKLLSDPPAAATVAEAVAKVDGTALPDADARRVQRYAETLGRMPPEQQDRIIIANKDAVLRVAREQGWLS